MHLDFLHNEILKNCLTVKQRQHSGFQQRRLGISFEGDCEFCSHFSPCDPVLRFTVAAAANPGRIFMLTELLLLQRPEGGSHNLSLRLMSPLTVQV